MKKVLIVVLIIFAVIVGSYFIWNYFDSKKAGDLEKNSAQSQTEVQKTTVSENAPESYQIKGVPLYQEKNFCYGESAMMILEYSGLNKEKVDEFKNFVKSNGKGGPPDIFMGFEAEEFDVIDNIHLGYSKDYNKEAKEFYDGFFDNPEKQVVLFEDKNEALKTLKEVVSQNIPVIVLIKNGNHYVVATGYDRDKIYLNDPDPDSGSQKTILLDDFLSQWNISDEEDSIAGKMGFPGDYGMIWLEK